MAELRNGITLVDGEGWSVVRDVAPKVAGLLGSVSAREADTTDLLAQALEMNSFTVEDQFGLQPPSFGFEAARPRSPQLDVDVGRVEHAALLVESARGYEWVVDPVDNKGAAIGFVPESATLRFALPDAPAVAIDSQVASLTGGRLFGGLRVLVLKFVVDVALTKLVRHLEAQQSPGLVGVMGVDPGTWSHIGAPPALVSGGERPRVLLLVHGWSSTTRGTFGSLCACERGREFLLRAQQGYSAVLGFDHFTQSEDPLENAEQLFAELSRLDTSSAPEIDVICFSRGGLVTRSLIELVLPGKSAALRIGRVVFVGAASSGTVLAEPENWRTLLDWYTTLAVSALKGIQVALPSSTTFVMVLRGLLTGVSVLAKAITARAITEGVVPGVAAMRPSGDFVKTLNQTQLGQPAATDVDYCAVTGNFEPALADASGIGQVPAQILKMLADKGVDDLFGEPNDLVVNTASMTALDPGFNFGGRVLDTGPSGAVYHLNYFAQDAVAAKLIEWLDLAMVQPDAVFDRLAAIPE